MPRNSALQLVCLIAAFSCGGDAAPPRDLSRLPAQEATGSTPVVSNCAVKLAVPSEVSGLLEARVLNGAPGYGETPSKDSRDTVWLLVLPVALPACDAAAATSDSARRELHLVAPPVNIGVLRGKRVTVHGRTGLADFAWQRTPYVLYVDSVPTLARLIRTRSQIL